MRRLRLTVGVLSPLLLGLIARTVIDGPTVAGGIDEAVMLLLLLASVVLWRQGRRLSPDARPGGTRGHANHEDQPEAIANRRS